MSLQHFSDINIVPQKSYVKAKNFSPINMYSYFSQHYIFPYLGLFCQKTTKNSWVYAKVYATLLQLHVRGGSEGVEKFDLHLKFVANPLFL